MDHSFTLKPARARLRPSTMLAIALAVLLTAAWTYRAWVPLSMLRLPDNDDMMRLAEVRDWLNGQAFSDLLQHRLGPPGGASMHWSRLADLGPAAIIAALTPMVGQPHAELAMVVLYPGLLLLATLLIGARLAERLAPRAGPAAVILLALSFPMTSLFVPGRIDHHALQILLIMIFAERLVARARWRAGLGAGVAAALSLVIGLETLPLVLFGMGALFWRFVVDTPDVARPRLGGFALGLGGTTLTAFWLLRPQVWPDQWCDGFTPASMGATLIAAAYFALLAMGAPMLRDGRYRTAAGAGLALAALPLVLRTSSVCLRGPYGAMDPMLQDLWMSRVGEAVGLFAQDSVGMTISYGGLVLAGLVALLWLLRDGAWRSPKWQSLAILLIPAILLCIVQIRATYTVSALVAIPLAVAVHRIRRSTRSILVRVGIWVVAAGVTYDAAGVWFDRATASPIIAARQTVSQCTSGAAFAELRKLPPGLVMAPLDSAAYVIGATQMRSVGAPYHRNNSGNVALYRFFLGGEAQARAIAAQWRVDYVMLCQSSFAELGPAMTRDHRRMVGLLLDGRAPGWLTPLPGIAGGPMVFAVQRDGLSDAPSTH